MITTFVQIEQSIGLIGKDNCQNRYNNFTSKVDI
jgi:hypothetical protein